MIELPNLPLEEFEVPSTEVKSLLGIENDYKGSIDFGVIGSGQAGGRIAKSLYDQGYKKTVAINTALSDLNPLDIPDAQKLKIGDSEGSGKDLEKGEKAALDAYQRILDKMRVVFGTVDKIIISVGVGGGTGAGSLLTLVKIAQSYLEMQGNLNYKTDIIIVAALPTSGEKKSKVITSNLEKTMGELKDLIKQNEVGPIFLMDNAKIEALYRGVPPASFWSKVNATIASLFQAFNYMSTQESEYTSFDSADYNTVLTTSGFAVIGVTKVSTGASELSVALQENFKKTILAVGMDLKTSKQAGCVLVVNTQDLETIAMDDLSYAFDAFNALVEGADVHRGLYSTTQEGTRAYTLITGIDE